MITRRDLVRGGLAAGILAAAHLSGAEQRQQQEQAEQQKRPPNIVFILGDDLGWADLGCYGNRFNETPNIDRLAREGMRFTDFYAAAPVCSPTRASIMSGQFPARLGLTAHIPGHWRPFEKLVEPPNAQHLPLEVVTIAEVLRNLGYATAHFGKWHLGGAKFGPAQQGFDTVFEFTGHEIPAARMGAGASATGSTTGKPPVIRPMAPGTPVGPKRTAEYLADLAIAFMEANRAKPFFIHLCHSAPHIPLSTTPQLQKKYEAKAKVEGYPCHPLYAGMVEEIDLSTGRVLEAIRRLGLEQDTIVVFTSDNGGLIKEMGGWPGTSNAPLRSEKGTVYEGGLRVPLIVRWPGVTKAGTECHAIGASIDFYPTFAEAAGAFEEAKGAQLLSEVWLDGVSLVPLLRDPESRLARDAMYWHYPHYHHSRPAGAMRAGRWKCIEYYDTGEVELYNLAEDPGEAKDLASSMPVLARAMRGRMQRWRLSVNAQMPQTNPAYDPKRADEWWDRRLMRPTEAPGYFREK